MTNKNIKLPIPGNTPLNKYSGFFDVQTLLTNKGHNYYRCTKEKFPEKDLLEPAPAGAAGFCRLQKPLEIA